MIIIIFDMAFTVTGMPARQAERTFLFAATGFDVHEAGFVDIMATIRVFGRDYH